MRVCVYFRHLGFILLGNSKLILMSKTKAFLAEVSIKRSINNIIGCLVSNIQSTLAIAN